MTGPLIRRTPLYGRPTFVYRCYDAAGRLLYVGCSTNPRERLNGHRASSWWFPQVATVRNVVFPSREYALTKERQAIAEEQPRWNLKSRWPYRSLWTADDYRDYFTALVRTPNGGVGTTRHLEAVANEARRRYGLRLTAEENAA